MYENIFDFKMNKKLLFKVLLVILTAAIIAIVIFNKKSQISFTESQISLTGKLIDYQANKKGDIDSLIIQSSNNDILIHFPPHTAFKIMNTAPKNSQIEVTYTKKKHFLDKNSDNHLLSISNKNNDQYLNLTDIKNNPVDKGTNISIILKNYKINFDSKNQANAIISDNYFIDLRPHILKEIMPLMDKAKKIEIKGLLRSENGFVNSNGYKYLKAESLILDEQIYLLK